MADNYYIIVGQSNAVGILTYGGLAEKLSVNGQSAELINFTKGGTEIEQFLPDHDSISLYGLALGRIRNFGATGKIAGIVFWQGERDAGTHPDWYLYWLERVATVLQSLRVDCDCLNVPIAFVILNSLPHSTAFPHWAQIRNYGQRVTLLNCTKIDPTPYEWATDAAYPNDKVHLTQAGYQAISQDIANIFLRG